MKVVVGTTPRALPVAAGDQPVIQNLGPGAIAVDYEAEVAMSSGLRVPAGAVYEFPHDLTRTVYAVADAEATDVRILVVG